MRDSDQLQQRGALNKSWTTNYRRNMGWMVEQSSYVPGHTEAHTATPMQAVDHRIQKLKTEQRRLQVQIDQLEILKENI